MVSKGLFILVLILFSFLFADVTGIYNRNKSNPNGSHLAAVELPEHNFNVNTITSSTSSCGLSTFEKNEAPESTTRVIKDESKSEEFHRQTVKLNLKHRLNGKQMEGKQLVEESAMRDMNRIHTFRRRILENRNQNVVSRLKNHRQLLSDQSMENETSVFPLHLVGSLKSGVSLGSGEYFMDVFVGTPPKHFLLILDTGSDLNWIQCVPCYDCFEQNGPHYDPKGSSSFKNITCHDPRCHLVSSPDPPLPCSGEIQNCPYFYWYGDSSNTTGDFALETFTVNLTTPDGKLKYTKVDVMFGCGHWNRGLFHGAAGLLGLGRGPLSFSSQLQALYGHSFSYCLVDRNSDPSVSSKLIFGENKDLLTNPGLNFTKIVAGKENPVDTFYYVEIKSIVVGGERLNIPEETWRFLEDGGGGTIIDSGTTLSYFADPGYELIKEAFIRKINRYEKIKDFPILGPCYNVSGVEKLELPSFGIQFSDGTEWNFPVQNYFIWVDPEIICLAMMGTPRSAFSIIGNYQQQNFHVLYDMKMSRLGFAPTNCAEV